MRADVGSDRRDVIDGIEIVVARLAADPRAVDDAAHVLSATERARARDFVFDRDRQRFTLGRARLRELLGARLGVSPARVPIGYGPHGKPMIASSSGVPDVRFNVTHCDDLAVYVLSAGREVGVDVEAVRLLPDADAIADRFFSHGERATYRALPEPDRPRGFFNCWTRKEAFIKALGSGLTYPLDRFDVTLAPGEQPRILRVADMDGAHCGWSLHAFEPADGFVAAVVVRG